MSERDETQGALKRCADFLETLPPEQLQATLADLSAAIRMTIAAGGSNPPKAVARAGIVDTRSTLGFHVEPGTIVMATAALTGQTHEGDDVTCSPGTFGKIESVTARPDGPVITAAFHAGQSDETGEDLWIINVFDAGDAAPRYPFMRADAADHALSTIRAAVKAHDDRLDDENQKGGPRVPTGDDYNDIVRIILSGAPEAASTSRLKLSAWAAAFHIAREALLSAAANVLDKPERKDGEYPHLMQAVEHVERAIAELSVAPAADRVVRSRDYDDLLGSATITAGFVQTHSHKEA